MNLHANKNYLNSLFLKKKQSINLLKQNDIKE